MTRRAEPQRHGPEADRAAGTAHSSPPVAAVGRPLDAGTRATMGERFGHDFSRVRVHTDPVAAERVDAMSALAFTTGSEISFGAGQYRPETPFGRRLLAHELAHVVQQDGTGPAALRSGAPSSPGDAAERTADAAAQVFGRPEAPQGSVALALRDALRAGRSPQPRPMRAVKSWAGEFDTDTYSDVLDVAGKNKIGVDIALRFKPNKDVNARLIGMVQMVTSKDKGKVVAVNKTVGARSIAAGKAGEGAHIDQLQQYRNPLYATGATKAKDTMASTATSKAWGQHGYRYQDKAGKVHTKDALLKDTPKLPGHGPNASQVFESTAVAVQGVQQGTWYGSVQWGWQSDAANKFTRLPLSLVSKDVPTATFATAAGLWAAKPTSTGAATFGLPMILGKYTNTADAWLLANPAKYPASLIGKLKKNTRLEVTDKGVAAAFNKTAKVKWWKVTVVDGTFVGRVGWVMESILSDVVTK